jgi:UDP-glucose 4-epimerase
MGGVRAKAERIAVAAVTATGIEGIAVASLVTATAEGVAIGDVSAGAAVRERGETGRGISGAPIRAAESRRRRGRDTRRVSGTTSKTRQELPWWTQKEGKRLQQSECGNSNNNNKLQQQVSVCGQ